MKIIKIQKGFTIVELMIVVIIIGIGATVAVPSFRSMTAENCVITTANSLVSSLQYARSEAAKVGDSISIQEFGTWSDGWSINDSGGNLIKAIYPGCASASVTEAGGASSFSYDSDGFINSAGTFAITNTTGGIQICDRQISLSATGRPSISKTNCPP